MIDGPVLVTGTAGFIGNHVADRLLQAGRRVVGLDNFDPFYDVALKQARLARLIDHPNFSFHTLDLTDKPAMADLFAGGGFSHVVHLAGQAGVRYSLEKPQSFIDSNLTGFLNILEGVSRHKVKHLLYASSSSVYGANVKLPFTESDATDHPVSLYAASKKANELMAHVYCHQQGLAATGLRFFTVYGPWGRPDMALYKFAKAIVEGRTLDLHEGGRMSRDFTYIDDVTAAIVALLDHVPISSVENADHRPDISHVAAHRVFNVGNDRPVSVATYLAVLETCLGIRAKMREVPMTSGEVMATWADISALKAAVGYAPQTPIEQGIAKFVDWFRAYHKV